MSWTPGPTQDIDIHGLNNGPISRGPQSEAFADPSATETFPETIWSIGLVPTQKTHLTTLYMQRRIVVNFNLGRDPATPRLSAAQRTRSVPGKLGVTASLPLVKKHKVARIAIRPSGVRYAQYGQDMRVTGTSN